MCSSDLAGKLPGGARWMKLDLGRVGQALGFDLQQLTGGQANPAQFLEFLKASGGSVSAVGQEMVRGVGTTRYRGTLDLNKALGVLPSSSRDALRSAISKMGLSSLPVEVWVDAHKLVRRIALALICMLSARCAPPTCEVTSAALATGSSVAEEDPQPLAHNAGKHAATSTASTAVARRARITGFTLTRIDAARPQL